MLESCYVVLLLLLFFLLLRLNDGSPADSRVRSRSGIQKRSLPKTGLAQLGALVEHIPLMERSEFALHQGAIMQALR